MRTRLSLLPRAGAARSDGWGLPWHRCIGAALEPSGSALILTQLGVSHGIPSAESMPVMPPVYVTCSVYSSPVLAFVFGLFHKAIRPRMLQCT